MYFSTPKGNIVSGNLVNGVISNANYFPSGNQQYKTPSQLTQLMKEREDLTKGNVPLKMISKNDLSKFNISLEGGALIPNATSLIDNITTQQDDLEAGKKRRGKKTMEDL